MPSRKIQDFYTICPSPKYLFAGYLDTADGYVLGLELLEFLPGQVTPEDGLEPDNLVGQLQIPFFVQVGKNAGPKENLEI